MIDHESEHAKGGLTEVSPFGPYVTVQLPAGVALSIIQAVVDDPVRSRWGHHQRMRDAAITPLRAALETAWPDAAASTRQAE